MGFLVLAFTSAIGCRVGLHTDGKFPPEAKLKIVEETKEDTSEDLPDKTEILPDTTEIAEIGNRFAFDLYQQLRTKEGNLFFSPSSISIALAMTYAGAAGETETEMAETMHLKLPREQVHQQMKALQAYWNLKDKTKGIRLNLANRLWGQESYQFLPEFLNTTRESYGAETARLNFAQSESSRQEINSWVEEQTESKIKDLIPAGAIDFETRLVLTNAVYFQGFWSLPFKNEDTVDEYFHLSASDKIKVPMMHQEDEFRYAETDGLQMLELPYGDRSLSMILLLTEELDGLPDLESKLTHENLSRWASKMKMREVKVHLPRFKTTSQFDLKAILQSMGIRRAFAPKIADFSGMTGNSDLYLSAVVHKAFVEVNEEGTEAAAATGVVVSVASLPIAKTTPVFRADHPFLFFINDNRNDSILFMGRIQNPSK